MEDAADLVFRINLYLAGLPRNWRVALFAVAGVSLTLLALPRFEEKMFIALLFMTLAVFFFWMAIGAFF
jgi:hypothetical protein